MLDNKENAEPLNSYFNRSVCIPPGNCKEQDERIRLKPETDSQGIPIYFDELNEWVYEKINCLLGYWRNLADNLSKSIL